MWTEIEFNGSGFRGGGMVIFGKLNFFKETLKV
jgi:hypothetical protein